MCQVIRMIAPLQYLSCAIDTRKSEDLYWIQMSSVVAAEISADVGGLGDDLPDLCDCSFLEARCDDIS